MSQTKDDWNEAKGLFTHDRVNQGRCSQRIVARASLSEASPRLGNTRRRKGACIMAFWLPLAGGRFGLTIIGNAITV